MKKNNSWWVILVFSWLLLTSFHEYHVSIFDIVYNSELQLMQVTEKIFVDDLERALENAGKTGLKIERENKDPETDNYISEYLNSHFQMEIDGKILALEFFGKEWEDHHTLLCYFQATGITGDIKSVKIKNTVFVDLFDDQENMHYINIKGTKQSVVLKKSKTEARLDIK